ncbi:MAG: LamG-like jellyroll fold domain-containing protein [Spirochaetota bacterium]
MRKYAAVFGLVVFILVGGNAYPQTDLIGTTEVRHLRWGGVEHGWENIHTRENIQRSRAPLGKMYLALDENQPIHSEQTDLLLHFDACQKKAVSFTSRTYRAEHVDIFPSSDIKKFGRCSAGFEHYQNSIKIRPGEESVLTADDLRSFTIDFFLYPSSIHDDTTVISWYAPVIEFNGQFTGLKVFFNQGRLCWLFEKVFKDPQKKPVRILIEEKERTPINQWHHHALYYNAANGLFTAYYDGKESDLVWATENGKENGSLLQGKFSEYLSAPITVGERFLGYIDEFRISRGLPKFYLEDYRNEGRIVSNVMDLEHRGTGILKASWHSREENGTAVRVFCRSSNTYFLPDATGEEFRNAPEWVEVKNNVKLEKHMVKGRYFQWMVKLYGTQGKYTPRLYSLDVVVEEDPPPSRPIFLKAVPLNGKVRLVWVKNTESDIRGYKVYYGTQSEYYFGTQASEGASPVAAGNVNSIELTGLVNEQVYFFSITAVDNEGQESGFSRELIARPSSVYSSKD